MAICSFSRVVLVLFFGLLFYYAYNMYLLFYPTQCASNSRNKCLLPAYSSSKPLELWVYASPKQLVQNKMELLWRQADLDRSTTISREVTVALPLSTLRNGSLYGHVFLSPPGLSPLTSTDRQYMSSVVVPLTRYAVPQDTTFNLLSGTSENETNQSSVSPITHWVPWLDVHSIDYDYRFDRAQVPGELLSVLKVVQDSQSGTAGYLPILYVDRLKIMNKNLERVWSENASLPLRISYSPVSLGQLRLWLSFHQSLKALRALGFTEKEFDDVKGIFLDTSLTLLLLTIFISFFHLLFDFLAFKNDINFWRHRKTMVGLSTRTTIWRCFSQAVVFLYLMDEKTSLLVIIPAGIAAVIELWKVTKALKIEGIEWNGWRPRFKYGECGADEVETGCYDGQAMQYLSYLLYPLVVAGAVYQLLYASYTSWYSWVIHSLVNGVYAFGFLFMLPQLFLNYKLKSVAHLPWRAFMYKAFNTFIDDVFAFIIVMPTSHRIAVFRDDLVFVVYLYQRWLYPVDWSRVNEYGESFDGRVDVKKKAD